MDVPGAIPLCDLLGYMAKMLRCHSPSLVTFHDFIDAFNPSLIKGIFSLDQFSITSKTVFLSLLISFHNIDEVFIEQSFPFLLVNMTEPMYAEDICKPEKGCNLNPDCARFVGLSARNIALAYGVNYGGPVAWRWMRNLWRIYRGSLAYTPGIRGLITALNSMPATAAAVGASSSSINSAVFELVPLAAHSVSGVSGIVTQSSQRGTMVVNGLRAWHSAPNLLKASTPLQSLYGDCQHLP